MKEVPLEKQLHEKLKADLISGFLKKESHVLTWKSQFSLYCDVDADVLTKDIIDQFNYLEETKMMEIGNYTVLKEIFKWINVKALAFIDEASDGIHKACQDSKQKS